MCNHFAKSKACAKNNEDAAKERGKSATQNSNEKCTPKINTIVEKCFVQIGMYFGVDGKTAGKK